jgi:hypothetical protein
MVRADKEGIMTRKDYEAIARAIRLFHEDDERDPIHTASGAVEYVAKQHSGRNVRRQSAL